MTTITDAFCVFDVETTGPDPLRDRVIQVGWARFEARTMTESGARLVDPGVSWERGAYVIHGQDGVGITIPKGAYDVHGITVPDLKGQKKFPWVWRELSLGPVMVTYNGTWFDITICEREAVFAGIPITVPPHVDLFTFCAWHFKGMKSNKLSAMCAAFGIRAGKDQALHQADVDCMITGQLALFLIEKGIIPNDLKEALARQELLDQALEYEKETYGQVFYEDRETGCLRMGIGRYRGQLLTDVPKKEWRYWAGRITDAPALVLDRIKKEAE